MTNEDREILDRDDPITDVTYNGWLIRYWDEPAGRVAFNVRPVTAPDDVHYPIPATFPDIGTAHVHARHMIDTVTVVEPDTIVYRRRTIA